MFNSVQYVRDICEKENIPISRLERDCHFSNGYLNPKKMTKISYDRAVVIAEYLNIPVENILNGPESNKTPVMDLFTGKSSRPLTPLESAIIEQKQKNSPGSLETTERESKILEAFRAKTPAEQKAFLTLLGISED